MNSELIRPQTPHKSRTHVFKFLTPLIPSVEKIVNIHGFKKVYKPRNINILFSQCQLQWHGSQSHQNCLWRILRSAVYPIQWMRLMIIWCGMAVKWMGMSGVSVRKMKAWLWQWRQWNWLLKVDRIWLVSCIKCMKLIANYFFSADILFLGGHITFG